MRPCHQVRLKAHKSSLGPRTMQNQTPLHSCSSPAGCQPQTGVSRSQQLLTSPKAASLLRLMQMKRLMHSTAHTSSHSSGVQLMRGQSTLCETANCTGSSHLAAALLKMWLCAMTTAMGNTAIGILTRTGPPVRTQAKLPMPGPT